MLFFIITTIILNIVQLSLEERVGSEVVASGKSVVDVHLDKINYYGLSSKKEKLRRNAPFFPILSSSSSSSV